jgi:hypothetical protein
MKHGEPRCMDGSGEITGWHDLPFTGADPVAPAVLGRRL